MGTVWISPGVRATIDHLLDVIDTLLPPGPAVLQALREPVIIAVPSTAMQLHLASRLARRGPRLGVKVTTLAALAADVLAHHGEIPRRGAAMAGVLTRRFAAQEPVLSADLGHLADGYAAVVDSVRDLLDAGFEPVHLDAADELLSSASKDEAAIAAALGLPVPTAASTQDDGSAEQRAAAVLRIAAQVHESLELLQVGERSWIFRRAVELLPQTPAPGRAIWVAGFADATGLIGDFIEGLMRWYGADVIVDKPADPADHMREDAGAAFADVLVGRLGMVGPVKSLQAINPPAQRTLFCAPGIGAEVRSVARRVRRLLDGGEQPQQIGIVARQLESYRPAIWRELRRMGIPFSGLEAVGSDSIEARRIGALLDVLCDGPTVRIDRWLEACGWLTERPGQDERDENRLRRAELLMVLSTAGVGRLQDVPTAEPPEVNADGVPLQVREGFAPDEVEARRGFLVKTRRRHMPHALLLRAKRRAAGLLAFWEAWPDEAPLKLHVRLMRALLTDQLRWQGEPIAAREVADVISDIQRVHEGSLQMSLQEFRLLLISQLRPIGRNPLGGAGGGVQVLSAVEARGLSFSHLFVIGLNRDMFPRRAQEDALLSDRMRRRLHDLIPTLPLRAQSYMGERHLFAWLHTAARFITLSWQRTDDSGKPALPSPLVERLRWSQGGGTVTVDEDPPSYSGLTPPGEELAFDACVRAGLHGTRERFARLLPLAMAEARSDDEAAGLEPVTRARLRVLDALEPDIRSPTGKLEAARLDPYSGLVGPILDPLDPRRNALYITVLEKTARCPWQSFLLQVLRLEPTPDPIHDLPNIEKWMLGDLVHAVLEEVIRDALGAEAEARTELRRALQLGAVEVCWPDTAEMDGVLERVTRRAVKSLGMNLPGMALVMRDMAEPFLAVAREVDWPDSGAGLPVIGVEIEGEVPAPSGGRPVYFKADRADLVDGQLRLTDYKTGRPIDTGRLPETRARNFLKQVRSGQRLQASTYTLARAEGISDRLGRFLFLNPDDEEHTRDFSVEGSDPEFIDATGEAFVAVLEAWDRGMFFPRITEPSGMRQSKACHGCDARQACRLGDSGYRQRLTGWIKQQTPELGPGDPLRPLTRLWWLGEDLPKKENGTDG